MILHQEIAWDLKGSKFPKIICIGKWEKNLEIKFSLRRKKKSTFASSSFAYFAVFTLITDIRYICLVWAIQQKWAGGGVFVICNTWLLSAFGYKLFQR